MVPPKIPLKLTLNELKALIMYVPHWTKPKRTDDVYGLTRAILGELTPTLRAKALRPQKSYRMTLCLYQAIALRLYLKIVVEIPEKDFKIPNYEKKVLYEKYLYLDQAINNI